VDGTLYVPEHNPVAGATSLYLAHQGVPPSRPHPHDQMVAVLTVSCAPREPCDLRAAGGCGISEPFSPRSSEVSPLPTTIDPTYSTIVVIKEACSEMLS